MATARGPITAPIPVEGARPAIRAGTPGFGVAPIPQTYDSAQAQLQALLAQWGLGDLAAWAWERITGGSSYDQVIYELRQTPTYKQRFAGNTARTANGLPPMTELEYIGWERDARQLFSYYGLPKGFYDQPDDFAGFIGKDVSIAELNDRVVEARKLVDAEPEAVKAMARLYGVDTGSATAYFLDEARAVPALQRQVTASSLAGIGARTGFGEIDRMAAEHLASLGVTPAGAEQGFSQLAGMKQITGPIVGDVEAGLTQDQQLGAVFDQNATNVEQLSRRQRARLANFQAPTGAYTQTQGV